jgi:hypothetical protein
VSLLPVRFELFRGMTGAPLLGKVLVTAFLGALTFMLVTVFNLGATTVWGVTMSVLIGGVALVAQFLVDFERRIGEIEARHDERLAGVGQLIQREFSKVNEATKLFGLVEQSPVQADLIVDLVSSAGRLDRSAPQVVQGFVQREMSRVSETLQQLGAGGDLIYDGEDRDWLLALAASSHTSIDALSFSREASFWESDLGQRYLETQRESAHRGVRIRRLFLVEDTATLPAAHSLATLHRELGIHARILDATTVAGRAAMVAEFVVFDDVLSYEATPASLMTDGRVATVITRVVTRPARVAERTQQFRAMWERAAEPRESTGPIDPTALPIDAVDR